MSKQPRKQRKELYKAKLHKKQKFLKANLSDDLREEYNLRSAGVRKGDKVRVMRGDHKGHEGVVEKVTVKTGRIQVAGATEKKAGGMERFYPLHPSNLMITKLELKDERRREMLEREDQDE